MPTPKTSHRPSQSLQWSSIAATLNAFPFHCTNGRRLPSRKLRLWQVLRQHGSHSRMFLRFINNPKPHPQLAHLELGNKAVRLEAYRFSQFRNRRLGVQVHAKRYPQQQPQLGYFRELRCTVAKILDQIWSLVLFKEI